MAAPPPGARVDLGVAQVVASALAAVTSAVAASTLGVAGTIVGAGLGAVVATVGSAVYTHSLRRAGARIKELRPDDGRWPALRPQSGVPGTTSDDESERGWPLQLNSTSITGRPGASSSAASSSREASAGSSRSTARAGRTP